MYIPTDADFYVRLLVEVDITKPLIYKVQIEDDNGFMVEQQVCYEWVPMFCQKCHKVGHICKDKKQDAPAQPQKQKQCLPKEKGKDILVEKGKVQEAWSRPKHTTVSIKVGNIQVPTDNTFQELSSLQEGGDLFPSSES